MNKRIFYIRQLAIMLIIALFGALLISGPVWGGQTVQYAADELLVMQKAGVSKTAAMKAIHAAGATIIGEIEPLRVKQLKVPAQARDKVMAALAKNPNFSFVENNSLAEATAIPDDERYPSQWHLPIMHASAGWDLCTGSYGVPIAIIDSGVDPDHPDLADKLIPGYNFVANNQDTHDVYGHGTAVAGSAAAIGNNSIGVSGVAWDNPIMPLMVLGSDNLASYYDIAEAIIYAVDHGAKVINISFGGPSSSYTVQNAANYAWDHGAVICASAANYNTSTPYYPAACDHVVAVAATDSADRKASFSNYGDWIDITAPGVSILTTSNGGGYGYWSGTSFSSPIACGLAALVMSANPWLTNAQVVELLKQGADDLGDPGFDPYFGYGRINVYQTLAMALDSPPEEDLTAPETVIVAPTDNAEVSGTVTVEVTATDAGGIQQVELYLDGSLFATGTTYPYRFTWETTTEADGTYELSAGAVDQAGNLGWSAPILVTVNNVEEPPVEDPPVEEPPVEEPPAPVDTTPPSVSITNPADGATVNKNIKITVTAVDDTAVGSIELYLDGQLVKTIIDSGTISWPWNTRKAASGSHLIEAVAGDAAGNTAIQTITVYK